MRTSRSTGWIERMPLLELNLSPTRRQLRQFAAIWLPALAIMGAWIAWRNGVSLDLLAWPIAGVSVFCCIGLAAPEVVRPIFVALTFATFPIGWTAGHLLLAILFYGVMTPIGLIMRLCRSDPMQRGWDRNAATYWQTRDSSDDVESHFRQY
jgi:hypothetical protein